MGIRGRAPALHASGEDALSMLVRLQRPCDTYRLRKWYGHDCAAMRVGGSPLGPVWMGAPSYMRVERCRMKFDDDTQRQIERVVADIRAEAYRRGWSDALKALRKAALEVSYACPVIELPDKQGFAGLPDHLQPRTVARYNT